jgi:hypothetical protein
MKTTTWREIWPHHRLTSAQDAYSRATEALRQAERALRRIDQEPSARCVAIQEEIGELSERYWQQEEVHEGRRIYRNTSHEERDLIDSKREQLEQALSNAEMEHENTRPARLAALEEEVVRLTAALGEARGELAYIKPRVEMAYSYGATDPIYSFRTLSEAARALCPVRIDKNPLGETYAHVEGVRIRITGDASLASVPPSSLGWLPKSNKQGESSHAPEMHIHARVVYIVDGDEVLIRRNGVRNGVIAEQYAGLFDSLDAALQPFVSELRGLESVDIPDTKELPVLGELIRDTCRKIAEDTAGQPKFLHGQRRLREWQIDELIGAYWKPFINGPWDAGITGSYALLKHRCGRGETPNVYAFDTLGHFGFRVRTPDHDWIIGEIYCPPERFSPTETPDPATLTNLDSPGDAWLAELGPVKFCIRKATSRT